MHRLGRRPIPVIVRSGQRLPHTPATALRLLAFPSFAHGSYDSYPEPLTESRGALAQHVPGDAVALCEPGNPVRNATTARRDSTELPPGGTGGPDGTTRRFGGWFEFIAMVEAAGIEPASEDASAGITTCVAYSLSLTSRGSSRPDPHDASPIDLTPDAGAGIPSQPALATPSSNHAGEVSENVAA